MSQHSETVPPNKVAIPRLEKRPGDKPQHQPTTPSPSNVNRVIKACLSCRMRKVRCNGVQPRCGTCELSNRACDYEPNRRDRMTRATERIQEMARLLRDLHGHVSEVQRFEIEDVLSRVADDARDDQLASKRQRSTDKESSRGEAYISTEVGSNEALDIVDENVLHDEDTYIGFVGKSSELQWLRRLREYTDHPSGNETTLERPHGPAGESADATRQRVEALRERRQQRPHTPIPINTSTIYLDNESFDTNVDVDEFELPSRATAEQLVSIYMDSVQESLPILSKSEFLSKFHDYYDNMAQRDASNVSVKWLALLNFVFAVAARFSYQNEAGWQAREKDHVLYYSRAKKLDSYGLTLISNSDLHQVQITGLLTQYLMSIGHINRAWIAIGISIRYACALGLHLRSGHSYVSRVERESTIHTWWAVYCLDGILSTILGRPSFNFDDNCSVPLPFPLDIDQLSDETVASQFDARHRVGGLYRDASDFGAEMTECANAGSFLKSRVQISMISQRALVEMYSAKVMARSWQEMQQTMTALSEQLDAWSSGLPLGLKFRGSYHDATFQRQRLILEMCYIGTKILITRPFLCRLDSHIANQSPASDVFNKRTARTCVVFAKSLAKLLPDPVDVVFLYKNGPWLTLVHNIMQALTVLLLEISYGTNDYTENDREILPCVTILMRWLRAMQLKERTAYRAYELVWGILINLAPKVNADISVIIREDAVSRQFEEQSTSPNLQQHTAYEDPYEEPPCPPLSNIGQQFSQFQQQDFVDSSETHNPVAQQASLWLGSSFMNCHDEGNPITSEDDFLNISYFPSGPIVPSDDSVR